MAYMNCKVGCAYCRREITHYLETEKNCSNMNHVLSEIITCPECGKDLKFEDDYIIFDE